MSNSVNLMASDEEWFTRCTVNQGNWIATLSKLAHLLDSKQEVQGSYMSKTCHHSSRGTYNTNRQNWRTYASQWVPMSTWLFHVLMGAGRGRGANGHFHHPGLRKYQIYKKLQKSGKKKYAERAFMDPKPPAYSIGLFKVQDVLYFRLPGKNHGGAHACPSHTIDNYMS